MSSVEVTTKYATTVNDLPSAWAFVMERLDSVGPDPRVIISPIWVMDIPTMQAGLDGEDVPPSPRQFEVVVEGMVEEK